MRLGELLLWLDCQRELVKARFAPQIAAQTGAPGPAWRADSANVPLGVKDYDAWYYNRPLAKAYWTHPGRSKNLVKMIESFAPRTVFEFGSGLGHVLREARRHGIGIVGTETSDYAITHSVCPEAIVRIGEIPAHSLPFGDGAFDLVFSTEVMEHVSEEATLPVLRELHRICSGHALFTINTFSLDEPGHINVHPREWWLRAFAQVGFLHDEARWRELDRMKYLGWDVFVMRKAMPDGTRGLMGGAGPRRPAV